MRFHLYFYIWTTLNLNICFVLVCNHKFPVIYSKTIHNECEGNTIKAIQNNV